MEIRPEPCDGPAATRLVDALLGDLAERYGPEDVGPLDPAIFSPPGGLFLVAWDGEAAAACGAFKRIDHQLAEVNRMYVAPSHRRRGLARAILSALEVHARAAGYLTLRLETGTRQPEAIALYRSAGFAGIPCYPPYDSDPTSVCFAKRLHASTFSG